MLFFTYYKTKPYFLLRGIGKSSEMQKVMSIFKDPVVHSYFLIAKDQHLFPSLMDLYILFSS